MNPSLRGSIFQRSQRRTFEEKAEPTNRLKRGFIRGGSSTIYANIVKNKFFSQAVIQRTTLKRQKL